MPQTLGDRLDEAMRVRRHDAAAAARELGVSTSEVLLWMHDMQTPDPEQYERLLDYLVVEDRHLRGLILRSQMRRMQWRIRT
jgi:LmbE family N-acetylglucosaminyl deacetylase